MNTARAWRRTPGLSALLLIGLVSSGCGGPKRLDEAVVYDTDALTLKVVRYYESLFLHYDGEIFVVMCRDPSTGAMPAMNTQDAGWRMLRRGGAIGTTSAADLLPSVRESYVLTPSGGLIDRGGGAADQPVRVRPVHRLGPHPSGGPRDRSGAEAGLLRPGRDR
ncbi:MAG: hypothetical protein P8Y69_16340 [Gammaproteobacteria bacterium]